MAKKGIIYMIENKSPNAVVFSAANEIDSKKVKIDGIEMAKRQHIYQNLSQQITDFFPEYKYLIHQIGENQIYIIVKEKLENTEETYNNIQEVIESYLF